MKRTFAAAVAAVTAGTSIWLATVPANARPKPAAIPSATVQVVPKWTYQGGGKLAVITACSQRGDLHVVTSKLLGHPVALPGRNLLIRVTNKTKPQKYTITLWCVAKSGLVDAMDMKWAKVLKRLPDWEQQPAPHLPRHFKPDVTVQSDPPAVVKPPMARGTRGHAKKGHHSRH